MSARYIYVIEKSVVATITGFLSYRCLTEQDQEEQHNVRASLLGHFIFLALLTVFDYSIEYSIQWIPFYYEIKCILLLIASIFALFLNRKSGYDYLAYPIMKLSDTYVVPYLIDYANSLLYYFVALLSPYVGEKHLEDMHVYVKEASKIVDEKFATNPVQSKVEFSSKPESKPVDPSRLSATLPRNFKMHSAVLLVTQQN